MVTGPGLPGDEVVAGHGHRIGSPGRVQHRPRRQRQEVAAVGVATDSHPGWIAAAQVPLPVARTAVSLAKPTTVDRIARRRSPTPVARTPPHRADDDRRPLGPTPRTPLATRGRDRAGRSLTSTERLKNANRTTLPCRIRGNSERHPRRPQECPHGRPAPTSASDQRFQRAMSTTSYCSRSGEREKRRLCDTSGRPSPRGSRTRQNRTSWPESRRREEQRFEDVGTALALQVFGAAGDHVLPTEPRPAGT